MAAQVYMVHRLGQPEPVVLPTRYKSMEDAIDGAKADFSATFEQTNHKVLPITASFQVKPIGPTKEGLEVWDGNNQLGAYQIDAV